MTTAKKKFWLPTNSVVLGSVLLTSTLVLSGCGDSSVPAEQQENAALTQPAQTNAMDVKQPEPQASVKQPLTSLPANVSMDKPAPETVSEKTSMPEISPKVPSADEVEQSVEAKLEEIKQEVQVVEKTNASVASTIDGGSVYSTCAGCHGAQGEGGIGPKLAGQSVDAMVDKLKRYKAGEQIGPLTGMMAPMAAPLTEEQMTAVASYVSGL